MKKAMTATLALCTLMNWTAYAEDGVTPVPFGFSTVVENGKYVSYWFENYIRQGVEGDPKNVVDTIYGVDRGREIYDPKGEAWHWLDANANGKMAVEKEVWIPYVFQDEPVGSTQGKWVRYGKNGQMVKGLYTVDDSVLSGFYTQYGNRYYYDPITGAMAKGEMEIDGARIHFDELTGVAVDDHVWKRAYAEYIASLEKEIKSDTVTHLLLVDRDFIPELTIDYPINDNMTKTLLASYRDGVITLLASYESERDPYGEQGYGVGIKACVERKNMFVYQSRTGTRVYSHVMKYNGKTYEQIAEGSFDVKDSMPCCGGALHEDCLFDGKEVGYEEYLELLSNAVDNEELTYCNVKYVEKYAPELAVASNDYDKITYGTYYNTYVYPVDDIGFMIKENGTIVSLKDGIAHPWILYACPDYDATNDILIERYYIVGDEDCCILAVNGDRMDYCGYASISRNYKLDEEAASVTWAVEPSFRFERIKDLGNYPHVTNVNGTDGVFLADMKGYSQNWHGDYNANTMIVQIDGKQGIYDYSGNVVYPVELEVMDPYGLGIGVVYDVNANMFRFGVMREPRIGGKGSVFSDDFASLSDASISTDYYDADGPRNMFAIRDGVLGIAHLRTNEPWFEPYAYKGKLIARVFHDDDPFASYNPEFVVVEDGEVMTKVDPDFAYVGLINGFYTVRIGEYNEYQYGLVDATSGNHITMSMYDEIKWFQDGLCPVKYNGKWGYVNEAGEPVTKYVFDDASVVYEGKAYVAIDGYYGIIDLEKTISRGIAIDYSTCTSGWKTEE